MTRLLDLAGQRFHRWKVIRKSPVVVKGTAYWECICNCGTEKVINSQTLRNGGSKSCGCWRSDESRTRHTTHGHSGTKMYRTWQGMKRRCLEKSNALYPYYGGRGIKICQRWMKFENFLADMGEPWDPKLSIDRRDPDKNYERSNCRWKFQFEQNRNKRNNKLTLAKAIAIVRLRNKSGMTYKDIGKIYNIGQDHVWQVCKGTLWAEAVRLAKCSKYKHAGC